jgi:hypothetical protein
MNANSASAVVAARRWHNRVIVVLVGGIGLDREAADGRRMSV